MPPEFSSVEGLARAGQRRAWLAGLFFLLLFCFTYSHHRSLGGGTALSRLDLLGALVYHGTFAIDSHHGNTPDKAYYQGHYYSDKAPGTALMALPAYEAGALAAQAAGIDPESKQGWLLTSWAACAGSLAVVAALGGTALYCWLARRSGPKAALIATLAVFLGAAPLPYATMLFSHAAVAGLLAISLWALDCPPGLDGASRLRLEILGGFACGLALASEYTAGIVVAGLVVWAGCRRAASLPAVVGGMIAPLLLIPAYSWVCLGLPWQLPYSYQASFPEMRAGLYAIQWPDAGVGLRLLFSPARGFFFWTPFLLLSAPGYVFLFRRSGSLFWLVWLCAGLQIVIISGRAWDWGAGPTYSARYLTPVLPLLALPSALAVVRFPRAGAVLAACSILAACVATLTDACPELRLHPNPLFDLQLPLLVRGDLSSNLGGLLGLPPFGSLALFFSVLAAGVAALWRSLPVTAVNPAVGEPGFSAAAAPSGWRAGLAAVAR